MVRFFRKKRSMQDKIWEIDHNLADSFKNVRNDTHTLFTWIQWLYSKSQQQDVQLKEFLSSRLGPYKSEINDTIKHINILQGEINYIKTRLESSQQANSGHIKALTENQQHLTQEISAIRPHLSNIQAFLNQELRKVRDSYDKVLQEFNQLKSEIASYPKTSEDIKAAIDSYYSYDGILKELASLNSKIQQLSSGAQAAPPTTNPLDLIHKRIDFLEQKKNTSRGDLREKLLRKITRNSKEYVKNLIISMVRKYGKVSGTQLREMVVEEQGLCSKSSFYRILEEVEKEKEVSSSRVGKEKIYIFKIIKNN